MKIAKKYECTKCGSTKTLVKEAEGLVGRQAQFSKDLPCGWQGCDGRAIPQEDIRNVQLNLGF